jgi:hypothetical protein
MRDMGKITKQQLQGMFPRAEFYIDFGLAAAEVPVFFVLRHRRRQSGQIGIDQQVMMTSLVFDDAGRRDPEGAV